MPDAVLQVSPTGSGAEGSPGGCGREESADGRAAAAAEADENPLAIKDGKPTLSGLPLHHATRPGKGKKKKPVPASTGYQAPKTRGATLDMINEKLKELEGQRGKEHGRAKQAQRDPAFAAALLYTQDGEETVRSEFQKGIAELRKLDREIMLIKKRNDQLTKERDRLALDKTEAKAEQQRLHIHCLDLQKATKNLSARLAELEAAKDAQREELEEKFQKAIGEITGKLTDGGDERESLKKENLELETRVAEMEDQCESRFAECQGLHEEKSRQLEERREILQAREAEAKAVRAEAQEVESALLSCMHKCTDMRAQICVYKEKMGDFQGTITKSQDVFGSFGKELERMREHMKAIEVDRDRYREDIGDLERRFTQASESRVRLRKKCEQLSIANEKLQSQAKQKTASRQQRRPFQESVKAWRARQDGAKEEEKDSGAEPTAP